MAAALGTRRRLLLGAAVALIYLLVYLWAIRQIVFADTRLSAFADVPSIRIVQDWRSRLFDQVATFNYEQVVAVYATDRVQLLLSPINVAIGLFLGTLVGVNTLLAVSAQRARMCRRNAAAGVLGSLPALLTGFACCAPTFALLLGAQATAMLIGLRSWFFPFAVAVLLLTLWWSAGRNARTMTAGAAQFAIPNVPSPAAD